MVDDGEVGTTAAGAGPAGSASDDDSGDGRSKGAIGSLSIASRRASNWSATAALPAARADEASDEATKAGIGTVLGPATMTGTGDRLGAAEGVERAGVGLDHGEQLVNGHHLELVEVGAGRGGGGRRQIIDIIKRL